MIAVYKKFFLMLGVTVLLCLSASIVWSETMEDLVYRDGVYYKKFTEVPYTGNTIGQIQGSFKNGVPNDTWTFYNDDGQLGAKGQYKDGEKENIWSYFHDNGRLYMKGKYINGKKEGY